MRKIRIVFLLLVLNISIASAFDNFDAAKKWLRDEVYNTPGIMRDFYCNQPFGRVMQNGKLKLVPLNHTPVTPMTKAGDVNIRAERIEWEHIVPAEQFGRQLKECRNASGNFIGRALCRQISPKFRKMEADPINLVPAIGEINADRSNFRFDSKKPTKKSKYRKCGVHIDKNSKKIQVPDRVKGQVARAYLHMKKEYGMKLGDQDKKLFNAWDKKFPMTAREKTIRSKKMASVKKYQMRQKRILASSSRRTSTKVMNKKISPKRVALKGVRTARVSSVKSPSLFRTATRGASRLASRLGSIGLIVTVGTLVLEASHNVYKTYKQVGENKKDIQKNISDISSNKANIQLNKQYIDRLEKEHQILGININENTYNISKIEKKLLENDERFLRIDKQLLVLTSNISKVDDLAQKNSKDIQQFKDGVFRTGIKLLDDYYGNKNDANNKDYLAPAISRFIETKEIQNNEVKYLAEYYLIIARYEMYLKQARSKELEKIVQGCKELTAQAEQSEKYLALLNSAYIAVSDYEGPELLPCRQGLMDSTKKLIDKLIEEKKFDVAVDVAENYRQSIGFSDSIESTTLLQRAIDAKKGNYEANKNFTSVSQALNVIEKNQNALLNEAAIKYLYNESDVNSVKRLLKIKRFDNEEFRIKAFATIYDYLGGEKEKEKLAKLISLVESNPTYSDELKQYMYKYKKEER